MALVQAARVVTLLRRLEPGLAVRVVPVTTEAEQWPGGGLLAGGKGLFVRAVDELLLRDEADVAVHCLKDVPGDVPLPEGLQIAAVAPRDDVHDVLVVPRDSPARSLAELPPGAVVGTSSVRRAAQLRRLRADLRTEPARGAVGSRLARLDEHGAPDEPAEAAAGSAARGRLDALVLAGCGLARVGEVRRVRQVFGLDEVVPPVGAGVLALECRAADTATRALLGRLNDARTWAEAAAERALLRRLRGHCNSPIAGVCVTGSDGELALRGAVFSSDGARLLRARATAAGGAEPAELGERVAAELLGQGARELIDASASPS